MALLHEAYPNYRGLLDARRHLLFNYGDLRELALLAVQVIVLSAIIFLFSSILLIPLILVGAVIRYLDIHSHVKDPWYYPLQRVAGPQRFAPERSAFDTLPEADHFAIDERVVNAALSPVARMRRWFSKESFYTGESTRFRPAGDVDRYDLPLFGFPMLSIPGFTYPTGRRIIATMQQSGIVKALGLKPFADSLARPYFERNALSKKLPWRGKPDRFTVRTKWEGYIRSWLVTGSAPDTTEALAMVKARFDNALVHCHAGCTVHPIITISRDEEPFPDKPYPTEAAALASEERRLRTETMTCVTVRAYIHLIYAPHRDPDNPMDGKGPREISIANYNRFVGIATNFQELLQRAWKTVVPLARDNESDEQAQAIALPLRFGTERKSVPPMHPDVLLSDVLGRHSLAPDVAPDGSATGFARLDDQLIAPLDLFDIESPAIYPDDLRIFEGHEPPILFSLRWIAMNPDEERATAASLYRESGKRTEHSDKALDTGDGAMPNLHAITQQRESLNLDALIQQKTARMGYATMTIALYEAIGVDGLVEARRRLRARLSQLKGGLTSRRYNFAMTTDNAVNAVLGMMPGNVTDNVLVNPQPSGAIANLFTTYSPWLGSSVIREAERNYIGVDGKPVPALMSRVGIDRRRFGWAPQTGTRSGHGIILADSGSGKSTFIAEMINEYLANDVMLPHGARVVLLDRDGSQKIHAALNHAAMLVCGDGATRGFDSFVDVESEGGRTLVQSILESMNLATGGVADKATHEEINKIIKSLAQRDPKERSVDAALKDSEATFDFKERLHRYTSDYTGMLFSDTGAPFVERYTYVDIAPAMASKELRMPVTLALMAAIERAAMSQRGPMLLVAEEFWEMLRDPKWVEIFIAWLKRLRKFGVWIWLVTHSLSDLDAVSGNKELMKEQFRNIVVLPSAKFYSNEAIAKFEEIGISEDRVRTLAEQAPTEGGTGGHIAEILQDTHHRVIPTDMGPVALAICGSTGEPARKEFARLLQRFNGAIGPTFVEWVRRYGGVYRERWAKEAAALVEQYEYQRREAGVPETFYDPVLFDSDINDVAAA